MSRLRSRLCCPMSVLRLHVPMPVVPVGPYVPSSFKLQASRSSGYTNTSCRGCGSTWEVVRGHDVFDSKYSGEVLYHRHHMGILFPTTIMGPSMCLQ